MCNNCMSNNWQWIIILLLLSGMNRFSSFLLSLQLLLSLIVKSTHLPLPPFI